MPIITESTFSSSREEAPIPNASFEHQRMLENSFPDKWLVVRLSSLGDAVLCTGVMRYLHQKYGWTFAVLTRKTFAPIFENSPFVCELIAAEKDSLDLPGSLSFFRRIAAEHRSWGLLDWHGNLRSRLLSLFWRGPVRRYPKFTAERRKFLRSKDPELSKFLRASSVTQRYSMAVLPKAPPRIDLLPIIYLTEEEKLTANEQLLKVRHASAAPLVALHPFATHKLKTWPREYWLKLVAMLEGRGIDWFVVGQGEPLKLNDPRDFTGRTSLRELAALLSKAKFLVTGDSGPMHLASAAGTPVIALFGPTTAEWGFFPAGPHDIVLELDSPCRPCSLHGSGSETSCAGCCLKEISPEKVFEELVTDLNM